MTAEQKEHFVNQVTFLSSVRQTIVAAAEVRQLLEGLYASRAPSLAGIETCNKLRVQASALQRWLDQSYQDRKQLDALMGTQKEPLQSFAGLVRPATLVANLLDHEVPNILTLVADMWIKDMTDDCAMLGQYSLPVPWQAQRDSLLISKPLWEGLLTNKDYVRIGPLVAALVGKIQTVKKLAASHDGQRMISAGLIKKCETATALGSEAVGITYCVNKVLKTLPRIHDHENRRKAIATLRSEVSAKGLGMDAMVEARLEDLASDDTKFLV